MNSGTAGAPLSDGAGGDTGTHDSLMEAGQ